MSRIPNFPFRCIVTKKAVGTAQPQQENHNYTNFAGAVAYREIALRKQNTKKVEIVMVMDETTPAHHVEEKAKWATDRK